MLVKYRWIVALAVAALMMPYLAMAATAKAYQVTGTVLEISDSSIVIQTVKGNEKWEIVRGEKTKVAGDLKVGAKVTIEYRMQAVSVEVKAEKPAEKK